MTDQDIEEGGTVHSRRGPSGAHRWMNCHGSVNLTEKIGDKARKSGIEAAHGSAAHALLESCLTNNDDAWEHSGEDIRIESDGIKHKFTVDAEMIEGVQLAIDWARAKVAQFADKGAILIVEQRVAAPDDPDAFGTSDIIIIVPRERLIVGDFKYGAGVTVEPDDEQLRLYGHYAFETFVTVADVVGSSGDPVTDEDAAKTTVFSDPNTICELYIIQPRIPHPKGLIRRHVTSRTELGRFWFGEALPSMQMSRAPDAVLSMGDWCKFCPAQDYCPAIHSASQKFDITTEPVTLTDEVLNDAVARGKAILKQVERLEDELFSRAQRGAKFKDYKLVRKIASRVWKPGAEAELKAKLGDKCMSTPELLSPPAVEKLEGGKPLVQRLAMKPETGLTMAARTDKRDEVVSAMDEFDKAQGNEAA